MAIVSISRLFGAGGKTLGEMVADRLKYQFLHEEVLDKCAREAEVHQDCFPQDEKSCPAICGQPLPQFLASLGPLNFLDRYSTQDQDQVDEAKHVDYLTRVVREIVKQDNLVLLGRGTQFILHDHPRALKVLLVADLADRLRFMRDRYQMEEGRARPLIANAEKNRARLLKHFYPGEPHESTLYHLVINTSRVDLEVAKVQICRLVWRLIDKLPEPLEV